MTIKPINKISNEKKDSHGHSHQESSHQQQNIGPNNRSNRNKSSVEVQSSQLRNEIYEDMAPARHRRSPHKLTPPGRSKRNEHHHHHCNFHNKREQRVVVAVDHHREKLNSSPHQYVQSRSNCSSPLSVVQSNSSSKTPKQHNVLSSNLNINMNNNNNNNNNNSNNNNNNNINNNNNNNNSTPQQQASSTSTEEACSGYNSGDEHLVPGDTLLSPDEWKIRDEQFIKAMSERGFIIKDIIEDGACLFRAISLQLYGDQEMHESVRNQAMDYIHQNREYFAHFVTEDINNYVKRKRNKDSHGNHIEIQAISEIYNRPVELYCYKTTPINIFNSEQINNGYDPLRLSYQRGSHYNAIIDPYNASVGVGLGLAGYKPESQTREAIRLSEQLEIEKTMFEDKLKTTDWEATNEAIEEQVARESYLQWVREKLQKASEERRANHPIVKYSSSSTSSHNCTNSTVTSAEAQNNINLNEQKSLSSSATSSTSSSSASLKDMALNGNNNSKNNNTDLNRCDREQNSEQKSLLKKKDCNSISKDSPINVNNNLGLAAAGAATMSNGKSSSGDSDDKGTSTSDQYQKHCSLPMRRIKRILKRRLAIDEKSSEARRAKQFMGDSLKRSNNDEVATTMKCAENKQPSGSSANGSGSGSDRGGFDLPCTSKQAKADNKPLSGFYQSLLESSYADDGLSQLSEVEMLHKAIEMSKKDFFDEQARKFSGYCSKKNTETLHGNDEDSDTLST